MNQWLVSEAKWAREQALEATRKAEQYADPDWVRRQLARLAKDEADIYAALERWISLRGERLLLEDDEARADHIARCTRDAKHWQQLAEEQSARLAQTEDQPMFEEQT